MRALAHDTGHGFLAGEPGDPKKAAKVVEVVMSDTDGVMTFTPDRLEFNRGESVKFVISNKGALSHEFVIGTKSENKAHGEMMAEMPDMKHDDPNGKTVASGKSATLVWRFSRPGEFEFACLIPGHYDSGMHGVVVVK
jgi:uncharacterized cupredoxin-like copper-binding protein